MNRKPTKLHILDGTFRADRHGGIEPQPLQGIPKCPRHLSQEAKAIWKELVRVMADSGVLTQADQWVMERFCVSVEVLRKCRAEVAIRMGKAEATGEELGIRNFSTKQLYVMISAEQNVLRSLEAALGLSAPARAQLQLTPTKPEGITKRDRTKGPPPPNFSKQG